MKVATVVEEVQAVCSRQTRDLESWTVLLKVADVSGLLHFVNVMHGLGI